jgi:hypothetical protein
MTEKINETFWEFLIKGGKKDLTRVEMRHRVSSPTNKGLPAVDKQNSEHLSSSQ